MFKTAFGYNWKSCKIHKFTWSFWFLASTHDTSRNLNNGRNGLGIHMKMKHFQSYEM